MLRSLCATLSLKPIDHGRLLFMLHPRRNMHSRNKTAMELIAKGWSALKEVDRVIDYCELNDRRLLPLLRTAKENFELALEADNSNTHARYWLAKLHLKYHVPGKCLAVGAALLVEAANMGDPDAQYELGCRLRVEHDYFSSDQQAFYYLEKAVDQLHPGALYLLGAVYLTGDCVKQDLASAMWCFHRASEKGHAGAAIAYGSLLLRGPLISWILQFASRIAIQPLLRGETRVSSYLSNFEDIFQTVLGEQFQINSHVSPFGSHTMVIGELTDLSGSQKLFKSSSSIDVGKINEPGYIFGVHVPEVLTKFFSGRGSAARKSQKSVDSPVVDPVEMARKQFEIAAKAGCDLGFKWLNRLEEEEKRVLAS